MSTGILGGGLTGISLGNFLNSDFEVLERNKEIGGLCRSVTDKGFTFDTGSHVIFSRDNDTLDFMLKVLGDNAVKRRRNSKILYKGHLVKYPFENGLSDLPKKDNFDCLYGYIESLLSKKAHEYRNFREWSYGTFGRGISEKYMIPYNEKVWKTSTDRLSIDWIKDRVPQPPIQDVIRSSLGIETEGYKHQLFFYYPKNGGIQSFVEAFAEKIRPRIRTGFDVKSISKEDGKWIVKGKEEKVFSDIVSTIHVRDLVGSLKGVPSEVVRSANGLRHNSLITVMIGIDKPHINDISWLYIPDSDIKANRVSFPSNYSPNVSPEGKSSVLVEITCIEGDSVWGMKDQDIIDEAVADLHRAGVIDKDTVCYSNVSRSRYAYVIYDLDHNANVKVIEDYFREIGITLCGRFSEFKYYNMDACIRSAKHKAEVINKRKSDN